MFTATEKYAHDTLGTITVMGLAVLWVMRLIDEPCKAARLAPIVTSKPDARPIKSALVLLEMSSLVSHTGFKNSETWHLTDRGRQLPLPIMPATGYLLTSQTSASDESGLAGMVSQSGAIEQTTSAGTSDSAPLENDATAPDMGNRRAPRECSLSSSLLSDLISDPDQIRETEDARRARCADLEKVLDAYGVDDNPPRSYRSRLMDDPFITADRFRAAIQAAESNPRRTSPTPTGLAIHELLAKKTRQKYASSAPAGQGVPAGYTPLLNDPVFDRVLIHLAQHYGDLFMTINPRLVATDEKPNRFVVLVDTERPELKALITQLAAGFSRKTYTVTLVTEWASLTPPKEPTHASTAFRQPHPPAGQTHRAGAHPTGVGAAFDALKRRAGARAQ